MIKLNDSYYARINGNSETVTVGCQVISYSKVKELYECMTDAIEKARVKRKRCREKNSLRSYSKDSRRYFVMRDWHTIPFNGAIPIPGTRKIIGK